MNFRSSFRKATVVFAGVVLLVLFFAVGKADAVILFNLDNSANQTDPGTGAPWSAVGKVTQAGAVGIQGSVVYLGSGWVLTANHVTVNSTYKYVTFDGTTTFTIDLGSISQVASGVDLKLMRLTTAPAIDGVNLAPTEGFGVSATLVGWGKGRDPASALGSANVTWGADSTVAKRWGVNKPNNGTTISYPGYSYQAVTTIAGANDGGANLYRPDGLGDSEAAMTLYDSGAGLFQNLSGIWYLVGIGTAVDQQGVSTFGDDGSGPPANSPGDYNYFARISTYRSQISNAIPELGSVVLAILGGACLLARRRASR